MPINVRYKLKRSPAGWLGLATFTAIPVFVPMLFSSAKHRSVHLNGWGFGFLVAVAVLELLRTGRSAIVLEAEGIRIQRNFSGSYLPWREITNLEVGGSGKVRFVRVRTTAGRMVRLPAPMAGGGFDGTRFDAEIAEIAAAFNAARARVGGTDETGHGVTRIGSHRF